MSLNWVIAASVTIPKTWLSTSPTVCSQTGAKRLFCVYMCPSSLLGLPGHWRAGMVCAYCVKGGMGQTPHWLVKEELDEDFELELT